MWLSRSSALGNSRRHSGQERTANEEEDDEVLNRLFGDGVLAGELWSELI